MTTLFEVYTKVDELMNKTFLFTLNGYGTQSISARQLGYRFEWDNAKSRFGCCKYNQRVITLSRPLCEANLDNEEQIIDTILHEIAHAFAVAIAGRKGKGHGALWKAVASAIGCNAQRCYGDEVISVDSKYTLTCPSCGKQTAMHRRPKRSYGCGECCTNGYDPRYKLVLTQNY